MVNSDEWPTDSSMAIMFHVEHFILRGRLGRKTHFSTSISTSSRSVLLAENRPLSVIVPRGTGYLSTHLHRIQALPPERANDSFQD